MLPAKIEVQLNNEEIQQYINNKIEEMIHHEMLFIDVEGLARITSFSKEFLELHILNDVRVAQHMRRRSRKRIYYYKQTIEAIKQIVDSW